MTDEKEPRPSIAAPIVALAFLTGLPFVMQTPESDWGIIAAVIGGIVLAAIVAKGVLAYVRSRKPRMYADSVMPPPEQRKK